MTDDRPEIECPACDGWGFTIVIAPQLDQPCEACNATGLRPITDETGDKAMTDYPLYVREEAVRQACLCALFPSAISHENITETPVGRAFCQHVLETMPVPVPVDPLEQVLEAVLKSYHAVAHYAGGPRANALATLRTELEARGLLKEPTR